MILQWLGKGSSLVLAVCKQAQPRAVGGTTKPGFFVSVYIEINTYRANTVTL